MSDVLEQINDIKNKLKELDSNDLKAYAKELEKLGLLYYKNNNLEETIKTLEESLAKYPSINDGYKTLMNIYNSKRAEAAKLGDMNEINKWLDKMDDMRNIAKKGTLLK